MRIHGVAFQPILGGWAVGQSEAVKTQHHGKYRKIERDSDCRMCGYAPLRLYNMPLNSKYICKYTNKYGLII
jgi:hypothetical protein